MLDSVRSRLALWHTVVLAVLLIGFATATDLWMGRAISRREDRFLEESTGALRANVAAELGEVPLDSAVAQSLGEFRLRNVVFFVIDTSGKLMARSAARADAGEGARRQARTAVLLDSALARGAVPRARAGEREHFATVGVGDDAQRLFLLPVEIGRARFTIIAAESLAEQQELLEDTRAGFLIAIPLGLLLAWLGGYALARRSLAPVSAMSGRAAEIGATSLHERLPVGNPRDELGQLAAVFNDLLARLDAAFDQQRRFMADAAHELRTPVSIMRGEADIALSQRERSSEEYRGALEVVNAEGRRLSRIVGELFLLARADAGQQPLQPRAMYLDELVSDCVRAVRSLAVGRAVTVRCTMEPLVPTESDRSDGSSAVMEHAYHGDEELLRRLLVNLLDNAIKHAPAGSTVDVRLSSDAAEHRLQVIDRGAGISAAARDHVFERFFRADESRARDDASEAGGAGLGLAIARWVAEAHGGTLAIVSSSAGETIFQARLPRTSAPATVPAAAV
ncbi:MAG: two-component histidine kinase [Gemmatimonadetes bacterium]|nr:two-component histidine kinase [Gemmatimonadota bacterium]